MRWVAVLALVVAAGCSKTVVEPAPAPPSTPSGVTAAERLQACEAAHSMTRSTEAADTQDSDGHPVKQIEHCAWPPRPGDDADGFDEIVVTELPGPGQSEASDATVVDEVTGSCTTFKLQYQFGLQGDSHLEPPFDVAVGSVVDVSGNPYTGDLGFYPGASAGFVVHNDHVVVARASCAAAG